jgi:hypothetical protein
MFWGDCALIDRFSTALPGDVVAGLERTYLGPSVRQKLLDPARQLVEVERLLDDGPGPSASRTSRSSPPRRRKHPEQLG